MINEKDALELLCLAEELGIELRIDGGWGVDALLGRQTREHDDIDLFVDHHDGPAFIHRIEQSGFREVKRHYTTPAHQCWEDAAGRVIDLHLFERTADGDYLFEGETYPSTVFSAVGRIAGREVSCIPAREQVLFHLGYCHDQNDVRDVRLLCEHFDIPIPEQYQ